MCASSALARRRSAASVAGSAVRSSPSSTTGAPPTSRRSTGRVGPKASAATGSAMPACPGPERSHSATSASAPGVRWPSSSSRPRQRAPWRVASSSTWRAVSESGPCSTRESTSAARSSSTSSPDSFEAAPSTPSPTGAPAASSCGTGAMPGAEPPVRGRAVRDARAGVAHPLRLAGVEVDAVREPDVVAEPAELLDVLERPHAEALHAERLLVDRLGEVGVQADAARRASSAVSAISSPADAERRGGGERDPHHRAGRRVVEAVDRRRARRRGSRRGPRRGRRAGGRRRSPRGPSRRGTGGSAGRSRGRRRSRRRAGRPRRAGRCSGGRSRSCSPSVASAARPARAAAASTTPASIRCHTG